MMGHLGREVRQFWDEYEDDPGNYGTTLFTDEELLQIMHSAVQEGVQINIHAIGDRPNRKVLDTLESVLDGKESFDHRTRVEHAQHVQMDDLKRFQKVESYSLGSARALQG
ncbi:MAG: hypothetical protein CM1200mP3_15390 [Chloroflexota bacterium]|nr:MAG: hypothetical protein CM1200mP3_15390 [Chloroflexota bacterium]